MEDIGRSYTTETLKAAIAQSTLKDKQIETILSANGLQGELLKTTTDELANAVTTNMVAESQKKTTGTTLGLGEAFKGLKIKIKEVTASIFEFITKNPIGMTIGAVAAVAAMLKFKDILETTPKEAKEAFDKTTEKVDSLKSEIDSLNSELDTTRSRINELNAKENLTLVEHEELDHLKETNAELERELRIKQDLLTTESQKENKNAKKFFNTKVAGLEHDINGQALSTDYITATEQRLDKIKQNEQEIKDLEAEQLKYQEEHNGKSDSLLKEQIENRKNRIKEYKTYVNDAISDFMDSDDYLIEGQDDGILDRLDALYEKFDIYNNGEASVTENKLRDILAKADFQDASKQLEELGKSGELSISVLSSQFPELIEYLDTAGISAQELYQYIMALSDPDAINYDNVRDQFMSSLGFGGEINSAGEAQLWNKIQKLGDEEIVLEAYLKVRDQYGDPPEGWTAKDWIAHIQSELENESLEADTQLSISQTIDQMNTHVRPALDSLKSAWQDIFTDDGTAVDTDGMDILSTCDNIKSRLDEMSGMGLDVDYSAFEDLVRVLNDSEPKTQDVKDAFNALASSITQAGLSGTEDFETMRSALEDLGVANSEMAAFDALISNTEALKEAGLDLAGATDEQLTAFVNELVSVQNCDQALALLQLRQIMMTENPLETMESVRNILALAQSAGISGDALSQLEQLKPSQTAGTQC